MVSQKYRWDFIGLSTDTKPTSETSDKVVNGSTYYCSDTSKLYVYCNGTWYERKPLGGGGGGGTSDFDQLSNRPKYNGSAMTSSTDIPEVKTYTAGTEIDITNDVISATNTGKAKVLTADDYNYPADNPTSVALWLLPTGIYTKTDSNVVVMASSTGTNFGLGTFILMPRSGQDQTIILTVEQNISKQINVYYVKSSDGTNFTQRGYVVCTTDVVNALNSYYNTRPLSAYQGRVLNEKIEGRIVTNAGAPTTSTVGTVGQILEDTTNGKLYICTDATNPYVWEEVGAGGGGGGDAVYSTKTTSNSNTGGAVYIGDKNANQEVQGDPTTTDNNRKYFWALPSSTTSVPGNNSVNILGKTFSNRGSVVTIGGDSQAEQEGVAVGNEALAGNNSISIGSRANKQEAEGFNNYSNYVSIGFSSRARDNSTSLGYMATALENSAVAIGYQAGAYYQGCVALGRGAYPSRAGEVNIGADSAAYGFNSTNYRVIGGVHDGQELSDAATVAQGNTLSTTAPTTSTVGVLGQLYTDTTNMHTYQCTAISGNTYTWTQRW